MNKVTIKLMGGLGNYMFQIACAHAYGLKYGKQTVFATDDSIVIHKHISTYKDNILSNVTLIQNNSTVAHSSYSESGFEYKEIPYIEDNLYLNGYFQTEKYFKEYTKEIKDLFSYPIEYVESINLKYESLLKENTCSVHVRRGDYLNSPNHHPVQNMNYYMKAIKQMPKDTVFLIFSDDIAWCKQNFPDVPEKFRFVEGNTDYEDLLLMSLCNHNIICNSTFSWWGAWLNNNTEKKIIAPSTWFGPAYSSDTKDLYCENWIKI